jgi:glutamate synthase domain-containing protein 2
MRTRKEVISWDQILIIGAQLAKIPLNKDEFVDTKTVIGPGAKVPLVTETPIFVTHMSFCALSKEVKTAMAKGFGGSKDRNRARGRRDSP